MCTDSSVNYQVCIDDLRGTAICLHVSIPGCWTGLCIELAQVFRTARTMFIQHTVSRLVSTGTPVHCLLAS